MKRYVKSQIYDFSPEPRLTVSGTAYSDATGAYEIVNNNYGVVPNVAEAADQVLAYLEDPDVESVFVFTPNCKEIEFDNSRSWNYKSVLFKIEMQYNEDA